MLRFCDGIGRVTSEILVRFRVGGGGVVDFMG